MKRKTIFLVGADTGGHVVPVFALAKDLENHGCRVFVLGVGTQIEKKFYNKLKKTTYLKLLAGKLRPGKVLQNAYSLLLSALGFFQSLALIIINRPSVVFLKGNYATIPMAYAAKLLLVPIVIHESDAIIGKSNRTISAFAKTVFVSYPVETYKNQNKLIYSGLIMRDDFDKDLKNPLQYFNLDPNRKTILILGGSLGAHSINQAVFKTINQLSESYQVIHQTGSEDFVQAKEIKNQLDKDRQKYYMPVDFLEDNLFDALKRSDLVISRSGSMVMELAALNKPVILIPYPYAAADHQTANAKFFEDKGAAVVIDGKNISPTTFYSEITKTITNPNKLKALAGNMHGSIRLNGRELVVNKLLEYLK
ncbi:MAG: UDP-N-acetylglucosamine--N-acetylmuramyl-(pentapeptide) pyrophosphoryl-undecaprenol N-acetylglucosamine transferase [Patescibacteria group bacterium]|jgi:UDP-N-acetylglucosamine--N-acetylmuramyl-(pentapeptide) pyrophosphoryl-undecaprenol N-acetylglucosamine transferase